MASEQTLHELGRSVSQLHLKLARLGARLEGSPAGSGGLTPDLEALLDLIDAVDSALERRPRRGWFRGSRASEDLWRGLAVAVDEARDRLQRVGIEPAPTEGEFDPALHRAIERVPVGAKCSEGTIAATHRRGWVRGRGAESEVLRTAQVSVYGAES